MPNLDDDVLLETVSFLETLVSSYESARRRNPEEQHRHYYSREKLVYHTLNISATN
jgi:hypothetical protein